LSVSDLIAPAARAAYPYAKHHADSGELYELLDAVAKTDRGVLFNSEVG